MRGRATLSAARRRADTFSTRPFRDASIWNIPIPSSGITVSPWIGVWSSATAYAIGDCVRVTSGAETYIYRSATGGTNQALPTAGSSNAAWALLGVSMSMWYDTNGGTVRAVATTGDPTWQLRFNPNCWTNLTNATWAPQITDATTSNSIWNDAATVSTYATDYNNYVTVSTSGVVAPTAGSYDPKGAGQTDPMLLPSKTLYIPSAIPPGRSATDWTVCVHQPDGTVLEMMETVMLTGNRIVCGSYKISRASLSGDGWQNGFRASMVPGYAGLITQSEWTTAWNADGSSSGASGTIPHALALLAPKNMLVQSSVYPALAWDQQSSGAYAGTKFPMGQRVALPSAFSLATTDFTNTSERFARILGRTMQTYGAIVVDRGGDGGFTFLHEYTADTTSTTQVLRNGGGSEPGGTWTNDQMIRKILANTQLVSIPANAYVTSA